MQEHRVDGEVDAVADRADDAELAELHPVPPGAQNGVGAAADRGLHRGGQGSSPGGSRSRGRNPRACGRQAAPLAVALDLELGDRAAGADQQVAQHAAGRQLAADRASGTRRCASRRTRRPRAASAPSRPRSPSRTAGTPPTAGSARTRRRSARRSRRACHDSTSTSRSVGRPSWIPCRRTGRRERRRSGEGPHAAMLSTGADAAQTSTARDERHEPARHGREAGRRLPGSAT